MDIDTIREMLILSGRDSRFPSKAYELVLRSLDFCTAKIGERRHLSGAELCEGVIEFAVSEFGPSAADVLSDLNINETADIGTIVYNLIDIKMASKMPDDSLDEFINVFAIRTRAAELWLGYSVDRKVIKSIKGA